MHDKTILTLADAAKLVHAPPETLLQYIRRGELMAARIGKNFVITHASLTAFVNMLATRQSMERKARQSQSEHGSASVNSSASARTQPPFVLVTGTGSSVPLIKKQKGRRTQLPVLPPSSP